MIPFDVVDFMYVLSYPWTSSYGSVTSAHHTYQEINRNPPFTHEPHTTTSGRDGEMLDCCLQSLGSAGNG